MTRLKGLTALVTAAAQGIGEATAARFREEGAEVIATDIQERPGLTYLDVTQPAQIADLASQFGKVDVIFNCAGFVHSGTIVDCEDADWDFSFDLNVKSMFRLCRSFLPSMIQNGGGSIINMASVASSIIGVPNRCVYGASKAAVIGLTKSIAADFARERIRCNAICPGTVQSPSLESRLKATGDYEAARRAFIERQPMGRIAEATEIAELAVYLASPESAFVSGQNFVIDGGWSNV